jgi:hypothetical protein
MGLTWRNTESKDGDRIVGMTTARTMGSSIIRFLLAVLMAVAVIGPMPAAAEADWGIEGARHAQALPSHDCCDPEPAAPDGQCGLACAQAACGWSALPAIAVWPASMVRLSIQWETASILPDDTTPETATPPPRA